MASRQDKIREAEIALAQVNERRIKRVHEAGATRHPALWYEANMQAVAEMWRQDVKPSDPRMKLMVSLVVLRVLDLTEHFHKKEG